MASNEPVAIVGMECRFPGAPDLEAYWTLLKKGDCAISEIPGNRWHVDDYYDPDAMKSGKMNTRKGGFIKNPDFFDADFFNISSKEARSMDPQQRILLEVVWHALENANIPPSALYGSSTGVFIGVMSCEWGQRLLGDTNSIDAYSALGSGYCMAPNRVSYHFNFHGPSIAYDTACSSSLVAVYHACQSLNAGECPVAIAGGVNLVVNPGMNIFYTQAGLSAPDGICKPFSANANGIGRSDGIGVVVLKRLADAIRDQDPVYAVIQGGAINQDGRSNGVTAPNRWAQEALIRKAQTHAGIKSHQVQYIEAHGAGTALGDLIETRALSSVMDAGRDTRNPCYIGSVKGNIGHLEGAAGVAGLIKVALCLSNSTLVPSLHAEALNPSIPFDATSLKVLRHAMPWPAKRDHQIAGVSSFGIGGANAHLVLSSYEKHQPTASISHLKNSSHDRPQHCLILSGKNKTALKAAAISLTHYLEKHPDIDLADLCFSINTCRDQHSESVGFMVDTLKALDNQLRTFIKGNSDHFLLERIAYPVKNTQNFHPKICFIFSGNAGLEQSSIYKNIAKTLYKSSPVFKENLDLCDACFKKAANISLIQSLNAPAQAHLWLDETLLSTILFCIEYSLASLIMSWGLHPKVMIGKGFGEYICSVLKNSCSLESAIQQMIQKSRLSPLSDSDAAIDRTDCEHTLEKSIESAARACDHFIEVGMPSFPGACMEAINNEQPQDKIRLTLLALIDPRQQIWTSLLKALFQLLSNHAKIDWQAFDKGYDRKKIKLPLYPFQRQSYWRHPQHPSQHDQATPPEQTAFEASNEMIDTRFEATGKSLRNLILQKIAELTGGLIHEIKDYHTFFDHLAFDSLTLIDLRQSLLKVSPSLSKISLDFFYNGGTVGDLIEQCNAHFNHGMDKTPDHSSNMPSIESILSDERGLHVLNEWAQAFNPKRLMRIDKLQVHAAHESNVLIARHLPVNTHCILGEVVQDTDHTFFYEHEQDHVPGMYMTEAARQMITACSHEYFKMPIKSKFVLTQFESVFYQFAEKDQPLFLLLFNHANAYQEDKFSAIHATIYIIQNLKVIGVLKGQGEVIHSERYHSIRSHLNTLNYQTVLEIQS